MQLIYILVTVFMFGMLVAVHEFGHFIVAKLCGVRVDEFAIGWGPLLWSRQGKETRYSLRALPLGGFCAFGEDTVDEDPRSLMQQGAIKQLLILLAGSVMNFLLGFLLLLALYSSAVGFYAPVITGLAPEVDSAVSLQVGDELYRIDGERVYQYNNISTLLAMGDGDGFDLVVIRDGVKVTLNDVPLVYQTYSSQTGESYTGFGLYLGEVIEATPLTIGKMAWNGALDFARTVRMSLQMLASGDAGIEDMSGPVGIVDTISQVGVASPTILAALENIAYFMAFISVNLAVMNMLPIPALDGGRILFLVIDTVSMKLFHKKIPQKYTTAMHAVFFMLLMVFMLLITFKDVWAIMQEWIPFLG